jgi:hypothetical protein
VVEGSVQCIEHDLGVESFARLAAVDPPPDHGDRDTPARLDPALLDGIEEGWLDRRATEQGT